MVKVRDITLDAISQMIGVILGGMVLFAWWQTYKMAPAIENWLSPVVKIERIEPTFRDAKIGCFDVHLFKVAEGDPLRYEFYGRQELSPEIGLSVYVAVSSTDHRPKPSFRYLPHPIGDHWMRPYCFKMPGTILPFEALTIAGHGEHRRHPFWTSITPVPAFDLPPMQTATTPP